MPCNLVECCGASAEPTLSFVMVEIEATEEKIFAYLRDRVSQTWYKRESVETLSAVALSASFCCASSYHEKRSSNFLRKVALFLPYLMSSYV
jgi:hypothetical protein